VEDIKKKTEIPEPPDQLAEDARAIYDEIYELLIEEDRGDEKYKYSVAIAANSLYFYKKTIDLIDINDLMPVSDIGVAIRTLNSASSEWAKASRALLLTPQAELQVKEDDNIPEGVAPPTLAEMMGEIMKTKSKNENYSKRRAQPKKSIAVSAANKRKAK